MHLVRHISECMGLWFSKGYLFPMWEIFCEDCNLYEEISIINDRQKLPSLLMPMIKT